MQVFRFVLCACSAIWKHTTVCAQITELKMTSVTQPPLHLSLSHTHTPCFVFSSPFLLHLSTALPAATHLRTEPRKWGNQLQSGGGGCVRTIVAPEGRMSLWIGGSFMKVLNPVAYFVFLLREHQRLVCTPSNDCADPWSQSRVTMHFHQTFTRAHVLCTQVCKASGQHAWTSDWLELLVSSVNRGGKPKSLDFLGANTVL